MRRTLNTNKRAIFARLLLSGYSCVCSQRDVPCLPNAENGLLWHSQLKIRIIASATV
jgi:hypothetical protein